MEVRFLNSFLVLAEELHFGRAANRLNIAQPPLSRQIKLLEQTLGVVLLERTTKSVQLTVHGRLLQREAGKIVQGIQQIKETFQAISRGEQGTINVGYVGAAMHGLLPEMIKEYAVLYPEVDIHLHEMDTDMQVEAVENGFLDIGFVRTKIASPSATIEVVHKEPLVVVVSNDHPLCKKPSILISDLKQDPFLLFSRPCAPSIYDEVLGLCSAAGFSPKIIHTPLQMNTLLRMVESGMGIGIVPKSVANGYQLKVKFIAIEGKPGEAIISRVYKNNGVNQALSNFVTLFPAIG